MTIQFNRCQYVTGPTVNAAPGVVDITTLGVEQLLELHNLIASNLDAPRARGFGDKPSAVKRTAAILNRYEAETKDWP